MYTSKSLFVQCSVSLRWGKLVGQICQLEYMKSSTIKHTQLAAGAHSVFSHVRTIYIWTAALTVECHLTRPTSDTNSPTGFSFLHSNVSKPSMKVATRIAVQRQTRETPRKLYLGVGEVKGSEEETGPFEGDKRNFPHFFFFKVSSKHSLRGQILKRRKGWVAGRWRWHSFHFARGVGGWANTAETTIQ